MAKKTPPHKAYPQWTEARFNQFVRSALRGAWAKWPPRFFALKSGRRTVKGKKNRFEYQCNRCKKWFMQKEIQIDHIDPVGSSEDWNTFIERLFVGEDKLQKLCKPCHKIKGEEDNARKKSKDA